MSECFFSRVFQDNYVDICICVCVVSYRGGGGGGGGGGDVAESPLHCSSDLAKFSRVCGR